MTLAGPTFPLDLSSALQHLRDALGDNYGGATDEDTLTRALGVDGYAAAGDVFHARPWATAARLITDNTEYEVDKGLRARIDRKLKGLTLKQTQMDALAGILHLLPSAQDDATRDFYGMGSGAVGNRGVF